MEDKPVDFANGGAPTDDCLQRPSSPLVVADASVPSLLDSRKVSSTTDISITQPRYLPLENESTSSSLKFSEAFAHLRKTSSYVAPVLQEGRAPMRDSAATVFVNRRQKGNPMLKAVRNVGLEFRDGLVPDYVMEESSCCVLFLSVRYHLLHNSYLDERLQSVRKDDPTRYKTKVVLCFVDVDDNEVALREINRVTLLSDFTLVLAWSWLEAARYLETFKAYENKSATIIKEKIEAEFLPKASDVLTSIRSVNKTDVITLLSTFGTVKGLMNASMEELSLCPGLGAKKVRHLLETFQEPFMKQ
ncbi:dna excision repair protein ercc-1 [Plasmopara halstedii]|uniref:DNA excision repair protein ERCC-1 n=1 Tax=Plasmopara halstedii TaxID=4781 RepID=A0A0P1AID8_PLAHL|nr:dna excision repair protein ercc-1 [Plasmopara halstedii]CEG40903.1 dna excision repair protein ercc-1 [Plasmopara halstedii]|eukprot:XP_024577272.1 dna excision repair protein ercc-1 [Plasmopara halstedii]